MTPIQAVNMTPAPLAVTGPGKAFESHAGTKTIQVVGIAAGAGSATVLVEGTLDDANWNTVATITLSLVNGRVSDSFTSQDRFSSLRINPTALPAGATITARMGY